MAFIKKAFANPCFVIGAALVILSAAVVTTGLIYTPYPPNRIDRASVSLPPGWSHLFGTDNLGRDIFSRALNAGKASYVVGISCALVSMAVGVGLGLVAGACYGTDASVVDALLTRLTDVMRCIPSILFAMMIIAIMGAGMLHTVIALCFIFVTNFFRVARAGVIQVKGREYILWARLSGVGSVRVLFLHILPNIVSPVAVMFSMTIAQAILAETALTYLGLGVQPPDPGWGRMLSEAQRSILTAPWESVSVGAFVSATALGFNLLGDGLRDLLDVRS